MKATQNLLLVLLLAGCATYYPVAVEPGDSASLAVHTVYIDVPADGRDKTALRAHVRELLGQELPHLTAVDHPALADATLSWTLSRGQMCVDCGDAAFSGWSWQGELRAYHGGGLVMFSGSSQDPRCCPDEAFLRQLTRYLQRHEAAPFARGGG